MTAPHHPEPRSNSVSKPARRKDAPGAQSKESRQHEEERLDEGLEETFPASDPVSAKHIT